MRANWIRATVLGAVLSALTAGALLTTHAQPQLTNTSGQTVRQLTSHGTGALISRGKPVFCSTSGALVGAPNAITSGKFGDWSFWSAGTMSLPSWCAIHLGAGPQRLMVVWYSDYNAFDYIQDGGSMPGAYTLSVSADSIGGQDGDWRVVASITGNEARVRETVIPFAGQSWVKMTLTEPPDNPAQDSLLIDQIECFDVSQNANDTALFEGDSITALAYNQFDEHQPSFSELIHQADPAIYPSMLDEGLGGRTSFDAVNGIDEWLALNPDIHYWLLGWGTNDALQQVDPAQFGANLQVVVTKIRAAGHTPILALIPAYQTGSPDSAAVNARIRALNAQIIALTNMDKLIAGPDLYSLFLDHPNDYYSADGVHPNAAGARAMNYAWYLVMRNVLAQEAD